MEEITGALRHCEDHTNKLKEIYDEVIVKQYSDLQYLEDQLKNEMEYTNDGKNTFFFWNVKLLWQYSFLIFVLLIAVSELQEVTKDLEQTKLEIKDVQCEFDQKHRQLQQKQQDTTMSEIELKKVEKRYVLW